MNITVIDMKRSSKGFEGSFIADGNKNLGLHHIGGSFVQSYKGVEITALSVKGALIGRSLRDISIPKIIEGVDKSAKEMVKRRGWQ